MIEPAINGPPPDPPSAFMPIITPPVSRLFLGCSHCASLLALALVLALGGCHSEKSGEPVSTSAARREEPITVEVTTADYAPWERTVRVHGNLAPDEIAVLGAKVAGRIGEVMVDVGDVVTAGQPIARLDDLQLQLEVRHAETLLAQACAAIGLGPEDSTDNLVPENSPVVRQEKAILDQAQLSLERTKALAARDAATQEQVDEMESAHKVAAARHAAALNSLAEKIATIAVRRAEVNVAKNALTESTVLAPFAGVVQEKTTAAGAYVRAGDPVVTILRCDVLRFVGSVPEKESHRIAVGQQVQLRIRNEDQPRVVKVTRFRPLIDPLSRALIFEADVPNENCQLQPGIFAEADVVVEPDAKVIVVPKTAVFEFAGIEKVWRVIDGNAEETVVQTGPRRDEQVMILSGVSEGDVVVVDATQARGGKVIAKTRSDS